ncbi:MAG: tetratricopeptide repeat protein [Thermodesulfobacteriota bacterium]
MSKRTLVPCPEGKTVRRAMAAIVLLAAIIGAWPAGDLWAQSAQELHKSALRALRLGEDYEAIKLLSRAIGMNPRNSRYYNDRGVAFKRSGNIEQAMADYSKALEIDPHFGGALNNRGVALLLREDYDGAIQDFTRALETQRNDARLLGNRAMAYHKKGDVAKALADFEKAAVGGNRDPKVFVSWAECLLSKDERNEAIRVYKKALQMADEPGLRKELEETLSKMTGVAPVSGSDDNPSTGGRARRHVRSSVARAVVETIQVGRGKDEPRTATATSTGSGGKVDAEGSDLPICKVSSRVLQVVEARAREHVAARLSGPMTEIFRQGLWFLAEPDVAKALIRFEDVQKLAQRQRNDMGAAWCQVEINRIHSRTGRPSDPYNELRKALDLFNRSQAKEEAVITLLVMAALSRKAGRTHESTEFCTAATKKIAELRIPDQAPVLAEEPAAPSGRDDEHRNSPVAAAPPTESATSEASKPLGPQDQKKDPSRSSSVETKSRPVPADPGTVESPQKTQSVAISPPRQTRTAASPAPGIDPSTFSAARELPLPQIAKTDIPDRKADKKRSHRSGRRSEPESESPRRAASDSSSTRSFKSIGDLLAQLKAFKARNDEEEMAKVLAQLGEHYLRQGNDDRALHSFTAALGLIQKLGRTDGRERLLLNIGSVRERKGDLAPALENYSHALFLSGKAGVPPKGDSVRAKVESSALKMGLKPGPIIDAFTALWQARYGHSQASETDALCRIGKLLESSGRYTDSLAYMERAKASVLADNARLYHKTGKVRQAEKAQSEALEFFRRVDYSRYLQMKHQSRPAETRLR